MTSCCADRSDANPSRDGVYAMFDRVAPRYDLLNHLLSFGQDIRWRSTLSDMVAAHSGTRIVDVATGTADQLLSIAKRVPRLTAIIGIDRSPRMLDIAHGKLRRRHGTIPVVAVCADALKLPVRTNSTDVATISFGIRNVVDVAGGLREMKRILSPGGRVLILEFSTPRTPILSRVYRLYLRHFLPRIGGWISGDLRAYRYLNRTIESFPSGEAFCDLLRQAGFASVSATPLTFGIVSIYQGTKPSE